MMSTHTRRGFSYLFSQNSSFLCKSRVPFSIYHFSTSSEKQQPPPTTPTLSDLLIQNYHFRPQSASQIASVPTTLKTSEKSNLILSYLKEIGFSATQTENISKSWPKLLSANFEKVIKPKIKIFQEFGFSASDIVQIISKEPSILHCSADKKFIPSLSILKDMLGSTAEVAKQLKISGWYIKRDLDKSLVPNINFLKSCGVPADKIGWLMHYFPRFLLQTPENMVKFVARADQLGAKRSSNSFVHAVRVVSSMNNENLEMKMKTFRDLGFSQDDLLRLFRVEPLLFCISEEKIKNVVQFVVDSGKYDLSCIVKYPTSLTRSIEKRYKPRFKVLEVLAGKKLIAKWPSFSSLYKMTDAKFFEEFVGPFYNEVGEVYVKNCGIIPRRDVS